MSTNVIDSLKNAHESIVSLEPLHRNASPDTVQEFTKTIKKVHQYIGHITEYYQGLVEASGGDGGDAVRQAVSTGDLSLPITDSEDDLEGERSNSARDKDAMTVNTRCKEVLDVFTDGNSPKNDILTFKQAVFGEKMGGHKEREQASLIKLVMGYQTCTEEALTAAIKHAMNQVVTFNEWCTHGKNTDRVRDDSERLMKRDKALCEATKGDKLTSYVNFVLRTIDALKFVIEWKKKTLERGGREWKTDYRNSMFQKHHEADLRRYDTFTGTAKKTMTEALKKSFVRKHEKVITGRYQLLELYHLFGAAIFLDPIWAPSTGLDAVNRSRTFSATLTKVVDAIKTKEREAVEAGQGSRLEALEQGNKGLLRDILAYISSDVLEYFDEFLLKYPS